MKRQDRTFMTMLALPRCIPQTFVFGLLLVATVSCKKDTRATVPKGPGAETSVIPTPDPDYDTLRWTEIKSTDGFVLDIKYATTDNFVREVIYPCGRMFVRPAVADALFTIRDQLLAENYRLKLYDGYRPRPAQQKLWDKVPNRNYVAPPWEGSMHNRGVAIDLTLTDPEGNEIDMGTPYDFFGPEAHHDYTDFSPEILGHRSTLKNIMESNGFQSIRTEWWHYSFTKGTFPLEDWQWPCEN